MLRVPPANSATLMLLDTYGLVYRAFFALPSLTTSKGVPINAAYGFTMMLNKIVADEKPTHVIAAFDKGLPQARIDRYAEYKANRTETPDDLRPQFALVRRILETLNIPIVEVAAEEADDVIATLARQAREAGQRTLIVTGDLDLLQLVDERTTVLMTKRGITELARYDEAAVRARFELEPAQLPDYRGLKGDPSDNLPGIPGVGEKTAIKLMKAAGSLDALLANPALAQSPKFEQLLREFGEQARLCRDVSRASSELDVSIDWEHSVYAPASNEALYELYRDLEFKSLLAKLEVPANVTPAEADEALRGTYRSFVAAVDPPDFRALAAALSELGGAQRLALALRDGTELAVSTRAETGLAFDCSALRSEEVRIALRSALEGAGRIAAYDAKRVAAVLAAAGIEALRFADDAMLGAHLLNPSRAFLNIEDAAQEFLARTLPAEAGVFADAALRLVDVERERLESYEQLSLYEDVEVPLALVLSKMERAGVAIDPRELAVLANEIDVTAAQLQSAIYAAAGEEFNIGSPQQLGNILFGKLGLPGGKQNKTGWATGVEVLQALAREHDICAKVLEYREVTKLKNTYVDVIPRLRGEDGRLRTVFNQTATATGRLSSTNPNLQNIPVRGELGRRIRRAFVAPDASRVLLAADYSQIELRLMAHLSGDAAMRRAFHEGQDIHDFTARQIFGVPASVTVSGNQRRMAKSVNFGLLYGMSDFGLAQRLEIGRAEAKAMTSAYFARFPGVRSYIEESLAQGRDCGYVKTILGRRRYMPDLRSRNYMLRAAAEREATNAPLQGSAADLMKLAMVRLARALAGSDAIMLLQIHDELIFEVERRQLNEVARVVRSEMEQAIELTVPVEVTLKSGPNWYDVEEHRE